MSLTLDGFEVLRRIVMNSQAFPALRDDVTKTAEQFVKKQLNARTMTIETYRSLADALGETALLVALEGLKPRQLVNLALRLDPYHTASRTDDSLFLRRHLIDLATGAVDPVHPPDAIGLVARTRVRFKTAQAEAASPFGTSAMGARRG
jgi:hypothetical protein